MNISKTGSNPSPIEDRNNSQRQKVNEKSKKSTVHNSQKQNRARTEITNNEVRTTQTTQTRKTQVKREVIDIDHTKAQKRNEDNKRDSNPGNELNIVA